jgi:hypothetical protein
MTIRERLLYGSEQQQYEAITLARARVNEPLLRRLLGEDNEESIKGLVLAVRQAELPSVMEQNQLRSVIGDFVSSGKESLMCWYAVIALINLGDFSDGRLHSLVELTRQVAHSFPANGSIGNMLLLLDVLDETLRMLSQFRANSFAGEAVKQWYDDGFALGVGGKEEALYALGALGDESYKGFVQFKVTQATEENERNAAQAALNHWGIADYDTIKQQTKLKNAANKGGGCFIATAVFDSPIAPQVMRLREFRDHWLLPTFFGRILVSAYGAVSPSISDWIFMRPSLKRAVRTGLELLVKILPK